MILIHRVAARTSFFESSAPYGILPVASSVRPACRRAVSGPVLERARVFARHVVWRVHAERYPSADAVGSGRRGLVGDPRRRAAAVPVRRNPTAAWTRILRRGTLPGCAPSLSEGADRVGTGRCA